MFLQITTSSPWLSYALVIAAVIAVIYLISKRIQWQREVRQARFNPRSKNVNETNYNIAHTGIDDHRLPDSAGEAEAQIKDMKATKEVPTDEEFYAAKKKLQEGEK
jgi:predicted Zn-dependent peptidase